MRSSGTPSRKFSTQWCRRVQRRSSFCSRCGSPVPNPPEDAEWFEIPAGVLDGDPGLRPDRHIYVDYKSAWYTIEDHLPRLDKAAVAQLRRGPPR